MGKKILRYHFSDFCLMIEFSANLKIWNLNHGFVFMLFVSVTIRLQLSYSGAPSLSLSMWWFIPWPCRWNILCISFGTKNYLAIYIQHFHHLLKKHVLGDSCASVLGKSRVIPKACLLLLLLYCLQPQEWLCDFWWWCWHTSGICQCVHWYMCTEHK